METNMMNILTARMNANYDIHKVSASTFANQGMWEEAKLMARDGLQKAYGAVEFAMMLCHENGYPDLVNEIAEKWNSVWSVWFNDLIKEYAD